MPHRWHPITFALIVDNFGIQFVGRQHAEPLLAALQENYTLTTDWTGAKFAIIDIAWDYTARTTRLSMNGYIADILAKYLHTYPRKPQHAPHAHIPIAYGATTQLVPEPSKEPLLSTKETKHIQGIVGSLLYYARAVDNKLLATLSAISSQQAKPTARTKVAVDQLLDYVETYPNDGITY